MRTTAERIEFVTTVGGIVKKYYADNDDAHKLDHVCNVMSFAENIIKILNVNVNHCVLKACVYMHDIYAVDRKNHHDLAADAVLEKGHEIHEYLAEYFTRDELKIISDAVREHRASYKGEFSSIYSEILSSADRGMVTCKEDYCRNVIKRSIQYYIKSIGNVLTNDVVEDIINHAVNHMVEKYGANGYMRLPEIYVEAHKEGLGIDLNEIRSMLDDKEWTTEIAKEELGKIILKYHRDTELSKYTIGMYARAKDTNKGSVKKKDWYKSGNPFSGIMNSFN